METQTKYATKLKLDWVDALKAFALLGILFNHIGEEFWAGPWFTNPSKSWGSFWDRIQMLIPHHGSIISNIIIFLSWLGDSGPGVFIMLSGFTLTLAEFRKGTERFKVKDFYVRKLWRIYPLFLIIFLVTLFLAILIPHSNIHVTGNKTLLSILGLRFSDAMFFYLNPSWWFIWLILQFYFVFPFLLKLLKRLGGPVFFLSAFFLTILFRLAGLLGFQYNQDVYFWMTGSFFGTRLAEFALGMFLAFQFNKQENLFSKVSWPRLWLWAFLIYITGLISSFTIPGSLISNLFVTSGLSGLLYCIWLALKSVKLLETNKVILWIGVNSYAIFLFHQYPLHLTAKFSHGHMHVLLAILVLLASLPIAYCLDRLTKWLLEKGKILFAHKKLPVLIHFLCVGVWTYWYFIEPTLYNTLYYNLFSFGILVCTFFIIIAYFAIRNVSRISLSGWMSIGTLSVVELFIIPSHYGLLAFWFLVILIPTGLFSLKVAPGRLKTIILNTILFVFLFGIGELSLRLFHQVETVDRWGEFNALRKDPRCVYSLKPNKTTHLHYNNYDYTVKTNEYGMACPPFSITKKDSIIRIMTVGDAFTMPEGLNYNQSYPYLLEKTLNQLSTKYKFEVINAGVTGYGPVEELAQMKVFVPLFKPDIVIYQFFINEFEEVFLTPEQRLKSIGLISDHNSLERIILNSQVINQLCRLQTFVFSKHYKKIESDPMYLKSLLYFYKIKDNPLYYPENLKLVSQHLDSMKQITQKANCHFIVCLVPGSVAVSKSENIHILPKDFDLGKSREFNYQLPDKHLGTIVDSLKIPWINLIVPLKASTRQPVYYPDSWHWNAEGHIVVADTLSKCIINYYYKTLKFN